MSTKHIILALAGSLAMQIGQAQFWNRLPGGNSITTNEWFGADAGSLIPLSFETRENLPMLWSTDNTRVMRLNETLTGQTVGNYAGLDLSGFFGLGNFPSNVYDFPVTMVHVEGGSSITTGYRPMMRNGFLATRGESLFYGGLLDDSFDSGVLWAQITGMNGVPSALRFIYTGIMGSTTTTSSGANGLELGRFEPDASLDEGYFGLGDWTTAGLLPEERFDMLNGSARIRDLPLELADNTLFRIMAVDNLGVVHWRNANTFGANGCEWTMNVTSPNTVFTAVGAADPACPDENESVGIGTTTPIAKLDVIDNTPTVAVTEYGLLVNKFGDNQVELGAFVKAADLASGPTATHSGSLGNGHRIGLRAESWNASVWGYGLFGESRTDISRYTTISYGTLGRAQVGGEVYQGYGTRGEARALSSSATAHELFGAFGLADNNAGGGVGLLYGVYGRAIGAFDAVNGLRVGVYGDAAKSTNSWSGYFTGHTWVHGTGWFSNGTATISDAQLKTDVQPLLQSGDMVAQLSPKVYFMDTIGFAGMDLSRKPQIGFIAQEVETVIPEAVLTTTFPAQYDTAGLMISAAMEVKGIDYNKIIPVLVGAVQEQQATIAQQAQRLDQLEQAFASCCVNIDSLGMRMEGQEEGTGTLGKEQLRIQPNPFSESTTVSYALKQAGQMQLQVTSSMGKQISTLQEGWRDAGEFEYTWQTSGLAPGLYYVTLLLDGELLVKKAVKVK